MKQLIFTIVFSLSAILSFAHQDHSDIQVSLLTCDEGDELYSLFGHSALRIVDPHNGADVCYNWGMFNYADPNFYEKFAKGKLDYYMDEELTDYFLYEYQVTKRTVREQVLNLTSEDKNNLMHAIEINSLPENRTYKYDFFFDNCSSRIRDILQKAIGDNLDLAKSEDADQYSYRQIIGRNLEQMPWAGFGIDLALGSRIDQKVNNENLMFLPIYMEKIFAKSTVEINGKKENFVLEERVLVKGENRKEQPVGFFTPTVMAYSIFILTLIISALKFGAVRNTWYALLLFAFGILGLLVAFLWFGTDHEATKANYNIIWANPLHLLFIVFAFSKRFRARNFKMILVMAIIPFALFIGSMMIPQQFNPAVTPLVLTISLIYYKWFLEAKNEVIKSMSD